MSQQESPLPIALGNLLKSPYVAAGEVTQDKRARQPWNRRTVVDKPPNDGYTAGGIVSILINRQDQAGRVT